MQQSTRCSLGEKTHIHHPRSDLLWVESKPRIGVQQTSACTRQKRTQHAVVNSLPRHIRSNADPARLGTRLLLQEDFWLLSLHQGHNKVRRRRRRIHTNRFPTTIPLSSFQKTQTKKAESSRETNTERRTEHAIDQQFRDRQQTQNEN
jgi:hypothetical protein